MKGWEIDIRPMIDPSVIAAMKLQDVVDCNGRKLAILNRIDGDHLRGFPPDATS